jgi:hypothetical protein
VLELELGSDRDRALVVATMNAVLAHLGQVTHTRHCRDGDPERCGPEVAARLRERWGDVCVGLVGLNPALASALVEAFGRVVITDLDRKRIGTRIRDVEVWDGRVSNDELVDRADALVVTGTTLVNGTFDSMFVRINRQGKPYVVFGVSAAAVAHLAGLERICPFAGRGTP